MANRAFPALTPCSQRAPQGQNSFCFNFLLEDAEHKQFLVKAIRVSSTTVDNSAEALEEVRAAATVRSQYFVPLLEVVSISGYTFMRFPFLDGVNLAEYLVQKGGTLPEAEIKEIGISLLRGVADLSRQGIRHQDIKPENIFITSDGALKILDFGSARFRRPSFRGSTRTNKSHSSPEQILASKPINLERLRLTCDERSDVYAVGSVMYLLATGEPPFSSNEAKVNNELPLPIVRTNISDGLKRVINTFLNPRPRFRPRATQGISFIEKGDAEALPISRGGFFYNASNSLKRLQTVHQQDGTLFSGIIVDASKFPSSDHAYLSGGPLPAIVDPQTYLFQAPKLINDKFKDLPYFSLGKSGNDIGIEFIQDVDGLINKVFDFEISSGASMLVPPFFLIKEFNHPSWTFDADVTNRSIAIYRQRTIQMPLLKGVAVAENILLTELSRGQLIDHLTNTDWLSHVAGYFVLLECSHSNGTPSEDWLRAARELIANLLATGKVVIWSHAYLPGIVFAHSGVGLGMGEGQSQRSFSLNEDKADGPRISTPHLYLPKIFARIKWPSGVQAFRAHRYPRLDELTCKDVCCQHVDFDNPGTRDKKDLALHMIRQLGVQFKRYSTGNGALKEREDLQAARKIYGELKSSKDTLLQVAVRKELKPDTGTFLDGWLNAFHGG